MQESIAGATMIYKPIVNIYLTLKVHVEKLALYPYLNLKYYKGTITFVI
jgi:hypothetical protein